MARVTCLVTGAAGFIGSNLVEALISRGEDVIGVDNFITGKRENITSFERTIRFVEGDIRDRDVCRRVVQNVDCVFHLAALASVPWSVADPVLSHDHNVNGTLNLLAAARDAAVKRFVFASSAAIYGDEPQLPARESAAPAPESPYALHKLIGEEYVALFHKIYGFSALALRFFNVFGPRQDPKSMYAAAIPLLLKRILAGEQPIIYGDGTQTRDFIHVSDIADGLICAAQSPMEANGQVFNLGCGKQISINDLVKEMLELTGSRLKPKHEPKRPGDVMHSQADISKAKSILGFEPKSDAQDGLKRAIDWYRANL